MCSGALINPKHNITLYYEAYRLQNILHIPMRIDKVIYGLIYLVLKYFDCIR